MRAARWLVCACDRPRAVKCPAAMPRHSSGARHQAKRRTAATGRPGPGERARRGWIGASRLAAVPMAGLVSERPRRAGYKRPGPRPGAAEAGERAWSPGLQRGVYGIQGEKILRQLLWLSTTDYSSRFSATPDISAPLLTIGDPATILVFSPGYSAARLCTRIHPQCN